MFWGAWIPDVIVTDLFTAMCVFSTWKLDPCVFVCFVAVSFILALLTETRLLSWQPMPSSWFMTSVAHWLSHLLVFAEVFLNFFFYSFLCAQMICSSSDNIDPCKTAYFPVAAGFSAPACWLCVVLFIHCSSVCMSATLQPSHPGVAGID